MNSKKILFTLVLTPFMISIAQASITCNLTTPNDDLPSINNPIKLIKDAEGVLKGNMVTNKATVSVSIGTGEITELEIKVVRPNLIEAAANFMGLNLGAFGAMAFVQGSFTEIQAHASILPAKDDSGVGLHYGVTCVQKKSYSRYATVAKNAYLESKTYTRAEFLKLKDISWVLTERGILPEQENFRKHALSFKDHAVFTVKNNGPEYPDHSTTYDKVLITVSDSGDGE